MCEALGMGVVSGVQDRLALDPQAFCKAEMDGRRGHQTEAGVSMPPVIPTFEGAHPSHGLGWIREAVREREMILERLEGRFRKRIVIRDPGSRAARGDPEPKPQGGEGVSD